MRLRHGAHVPEAGGRLHSAEPGRSLRGHQPRLGLPHLVRLRARLRQRLPHAHHRHRPGAYGHRQAQAPDGPAGYGAHGLLPGADGAAGERLYTDVGPGGVNAGIDTVFVLSGEGTMADIDTYQIHPTWVYPDIGTLYRKLEETV